MAFNDLVSIVVFQPMELENYIDLFVDNVPIRSTEFFLKAIITDNYIDANLCELLYTLATPATKKNKWFL